MNEDPSHDEIDLREEFEQLLCDDPLFDEIDLREEFEDWIFPYDPNKKR